MSWEAVQWANKQRLKLPQEQLLLLLIANAADPDGTAFRWWKKREHWWTYLVDHSRQSRASVFRHLNTLEDLGLAARTEVIAADGAKRYEIELQLGVFIDMEAVEQAESQSHGETQKNDASPTGETAPVSPVGLSQSQSCDCIGVLSKNPKESENPPTPQGGRVRAVSRIRPGAEVVEPAGFEKFWQGYPGFRVMNRAKAAIVFTQLTPEERDQATTALTPYVAELDRLKRKAIDAHKWLSNKGWKEFAASSAAGLDAPVFTPEGSDEDKLWINFQHITGAFRAEPRWSGAHGCKGTWERTRVPPWQLGLAIERAEWWFVEEGTPNYSRWLERIREHHVGRVAIKTIGPPDRNRRAVTRDGNAIGTRDLRGLVVPADWPPPKTERPSPKEDTTGPPGDENAA